MDKGEFKWAPCQNKNSLILSLLIYNRDKNITIIKGNKLFET